MTPRVRRYRRDGPRCWLPAEGAGRNRCRAACGCEAACCSVYLVVIAIGTAPPSWARGTRRSRRLRGGDGTLDARHGRHDVRPDACRLPGRDPDRAGGGRRSRPWPPRSSISLALTARLSGPISRLAAASRRIAAGRYAERVPVSSSDEIGELAGSFNQMAESLESTERRRLQLVGDVAHELRTPLATLDGYLEGLQDGVIQPAEPTWKLLRGETAQTVAPGQRPAGAMARGGPPAAAVAGEG